ncbi:hypothetical protein LTR37_009128 [Vermiconidia calcicola]|uniref:Uncharacterized protein n=1 Tax=Vermiconidia calcicola TaxID=1690605 RepID=A0ACC3N967_9PEZI|nr:hypothetical protein LTR37_009128 [Vermiconidia calcicola]
MEDEKDGRSLDASEFTQFCSKLSAGYLSYLPSKSKPKVAVMALEMSLNADAPLLDNTAGDDFFGQLRSQADVNSERRLGKLLVDESGQTDNLKLWIEILRFRQRVDGFEGVYDVWHGMRKREIDLPVSGSDADVLWTTFIHAGMTSAEQNNDERAQLRSDIIGHAQDLRERTGLHFAQIHKCMVGRWLRVRPNMALTWHKKLLDAGFVDRGAVKSVAVDAMHSLHPLQAFHRFKQMYRKSEERDLYDYCIGDVLQLRDDLTALRWHRLFVQQSDCPSTAMSERGDVQELFSWDEDACLVTKKPTKRHQGSLSTPEPAVSEDKFPRMTRESMNTIVGDVHGIKPKEISDNFCAKLFATRAFSLDLVIKGLSFFGVEKLGPLAIREMMVRAGSPIEFNNKLGDLKQLGITFEQSIFARLAVKLANEGHTTLWQALLESDQHPETYEDRHLQEQLLSSFLSQANWMQTHLTLLVLSLGETTELHRGWNRVLQHYASTLQYRSLLDVMQSMRNQNFPLTLRSLNLLYRCVLPPRKSGKRYVKNSAPKLFDPLDFTRSAFIYSAERGQYVPHYMWIEVLKRYGMDHRWDDTERLVLWMVKWYSVTNPVLREQLHAHVYLGRKRLIRQISTLRLVFRPVMLKALFVWGFRSASTRHELHPQESQHNKNTTTVNVETWARGLALLQILRRNGIVEDNCDVLAAFKQRMWILFGPGYSTLGLNNEARRGNHMSLTHYINHANDVFPGLVQLGPSKLLAEPSQNNVSLLVDFFGVSRRTNLKTGEYANVQAWAESSLQRGSDYTYEAYKTESIDWLLEQAL